jgi:hypothetical protein
MNDIIVTSVQPSGSSENPVESFSLQPGKIDVEYKPRSRMGRSMPACTSSTT